MAGTFKAALPQARVRYGGETHPAAHGWMKPDFPAYDHEQAERGWRVSLAFFDRTLRQGAI